MAADDFAGLLRELKERSGLSYGALGKRLHMSASTLHRYVKGEVVPAEFGPVERLARLCRATPEELLELHRRWIRADALRGVKGEGADEGPVGAVGAAGAGEAAARTDEAGQLDEAGEAGQPDEAGEGREAGATGEADDAEVTVVGGDGGDGEPRRRSRKRAVYTGTGVGLAAAVALVVALLPDGGSGDGSADTVGASVSTAPSASEAAPTRSASAGARTSVSASPSDSARTEAGKGAGPRAGASRSAKATGAASAPAVDAVPVTVQTTPYYWDVPCEQNFLIDRSPGNVNEPPPQQDAVGWVTALGGVAADRQQVALTVQGTGEETVVLEALHVRVVGSGAPLGWNEYAMGVGCGGGVGTKSFDVSLDLGNPLATPVNGQRGFPYKVSESDPEVFYVNAHTNGHDVRWQLELDWSSGSRHGTIRIDDHGKPFRTSASGTDYYGWPLGGSGWEEYQEG
ncbi:helix-turn-helix domain-containing protein [Streptomyces griseoviridis]|uniref:Transcriptional regulator n=1 Tax=Streptomyces griseoviridis TaxID=45398 RepID=A0A918LIX4_STRGD|nr:transcriptional regulator [Streptomyces niveoruber]